MRKRLFAWLIILLCFTSAQAATIYGSLPDDRIYVEQPKKHSCTLAAATMLLRNYAFLNGYDFEKITVAEMQKRCWSDLGLAQNFTVGEITVTHNMDISSTSDKKAYLIEQLIRHPEGLVIYNAKQPHAVFIFAYRADTDVFFCADTTGDNCLQMISLSDTLLDGDGQDEKINGITKIWHIK